MTKPYPHVAKALKTLPKPLKDALKDQCAGDWTRVTVDAKGSFRVHNRPQPPPEPVRAASAPAEPVATVEAPALEVRELPPDTPVPDGEADDETPHEQPQPSSRYHHFPEHAPERQGMEGQSHYAPDDALVVQPAPEGFEVFQKVKPAAPRRAKKIALVCERCGREGHLAEECRQPLLKFRPPTTSTPVEPAPEPTPEYARVKTDSGRSVEPPAWTPSRRPGGPSRSPVGPAHVRLVPQPEEPQRRAQKGEQGEGSPSPASAAAPEETYRERMARVAREAKEKARKREQPKRPLRTVVQPEQLLTALLEKAPETIKPGVSVVTQTEQEKRERQQLLTPARVWVEPEKGTGYDWSRIDLNRKAVELQEKWSKGLPPEVGYYYLPDVLALYGLDQNLVDGALRHPSRVEIRPESYEIGKGYPVLGFHRGDVMIVLGLREPAKPCIIAAYAASLLAADTHRVGHTGGGGSKKRENGVPKSAHQVVTRLRGMGAEVLDPGGGAKTAEVKYEGKVLGKISIGDGIDSATVETDWQRMQRKINAITRRAVNAG